MLLETKIDEEPQAPVKVRRGSIQPWHAVTIAAPSGACAAAQACKGKRYLSREAPRLPLSGCDTAECACKYRHFPDRRGPPRRHEEQGAAPQVRDKNANRRVSRGRRGVD